MKQLDRPHIVIGGEHLLLQGHFRRFPDVPWIYFPHSLLVTDEINSYKLSAIARWSTIRLYQQIQRWALNTANYTMRFTNVGMQRLAEAYRWRSQDLGIVNPVGIDTTAILGRSWNPQRLRMLVVGRLIPSKNICLALEAAARLQGVDWTLDVVGDGPEMSSLQLRAQELGCKDRIKFHGHQADCSPWYQTADLLLFPSYLESLGLVLLEAMAHGVPCLAMRSDGAKYRNASDELIQDGQTGLLADGEAAFEQKLAWASANRAALQRMGECARGHVRENHSWDRHLDRYEELFEQLVIGG